MQLSSVAPYCWVVKIGIPVMLLWKETPSTEQWGFFEWLRSLLNFIWPPDILKGEEFKTKQQITVKDTTRGIVFSVVTWALFLTYHLAKDTEFHPFRQHTWCMPLAHFWLWLEERCKYTHICTHCAFAELLVIPFV